MVANNQIPSFHAVRAAYARKQEEQERWLSEHAQPFLEEIIEDELKGIANSVRIQDRRVAIKDLNTLNAAGWEVMLQEAKDDNGRFLKVVTLVF